MRKIFSVSIVRSLFKNFPKIDENVRRIGSWATFFGLVSTAMSWVASYITPIAQYGWGALVFAGIGAACVIILIACAALMAWRYFNPIPARPATPQASQEAPALNDVLSRLAETERGITQNKADLGELRTRVAMLTRSLRAHYADSIIKEADRAVTSTSKKLLKESYADESAWAADYEIWEKAMKQIDSVWSQWQPAISGSSIFPRKTSNEASYPRQAILT